MELPPLNETSSPLANGSVDAPGKSADLAAIPTSDVATVAPQPVVSFLTIAPFFFWGTAMVAMKGVMPHTTPLFVAGFRLVPAGLLVLMAAAIAGRPQPQGWKAWGWIALFAAIDAMLFQGFWRRGWSVRGRVLDR